MDQPAVYREQRRSYRVDTSGTEAVCDMSVGRDYVAQRYDVDNLSSGGALLSSGRLVPIGQAMRVILMPPGSTFIEANARVVRHHAEDALAIAFDELTADADDAIQGIVADTILRYWRPR